jgi:hypothetical protein
MKKRNSGYTVGGKPARWAITVTADEQLQLRRKARLLGISVARLIRQRLGFEASVK